MTDGLSFAFPFLTDSTCFNPCPFCGDHRSPDHAPRATDALDLTTFSQRLGLQSTATIANLLDVTANELYRRRDWPSIAGRVKDAARDLRVVARQEEALHGK